MAQLRAVFHDMEQARTAARIAHCAGESLTLFSPPDGARVFGPAMFREMIDGLRLESPGLRLTGILDCGAAAGRALGAIRSGVDAVRVTLEGPALARLSAIAEAYAVSIVTGPFPALDLASVSDPAAACRAALGLPDQMDEAHRTKSAS